MDLQSSGIALARLHRNLSLRCNRLWVPSAIHPEDLEPIGKEVELGLASGEAGELEARLDVSTGSIDGFLFRYEPLRDQFGKIVNWYGTNTDIDNLKRAEQETASRRRGIPSHHRCHTSKHRRAVP